VGLSQAGLPVWAVGLGALIATVLTDKNMILPVALVLAILDIVLVLTPIGTVNQTLKKAPRIITTVALSVPKLQSTAEGERPAGAKLRTTGYAGPADFVFLSMFFVALYRFQMRTRETLLWVVPTLLMYLVLVGALSVPLPALVPIGLVVMLVNWKEFQLNKEEKLITFGFAALAAGLLFYGLTRPGPKVAPLPQAADPENVSQ
jgi:hypothetical protein